MKKDHTARQRRGDSCQRCMLYVHGGAYFFGSVDEHRYQLQRHARKLQARLLAPRYRLAPQFPFPCGLHDCLAAYLYLLSLQEPETIVLAGDSAGGGMLVSLLVILRDQGIPMPAGAVLISPWVDLTHSFPSVAGQNALDYVPPHGFHHKPSTSWPPPNSDDLQTLDETLVETSNGKQVSAKTFREGANAHADKGKSAAIKDEVAGLAVTGEATSGLQEERANTSPRQGGIVSVDIDGKTVELKDQIQMYAPNPLLSHPLVSPVLQSSLGGLPPLCVIVGGGEMLRDEQIYLAHKAANPSSYPPPHLARPVPNSDAAIPGFVGANRNEVHPELARYPPTNVYLQVWDDLCHVALTLSFTRPAKFQFRSVAQFSAWALAHAQRSEIRILDDDEISIISNASSEVDASSDADFSPGEFKQQSERDKPQTDGIVPSQPQSQPIKRPQTPSFVGRAGDPLPPFKGHMIRQRVTRRGQVYDLEMPAELPACQMKPSEIGAVKPGPVRKWCGKQEQMNERFASAKREVQAKRMKEMTDCAGGRIAVFADGRSDIEAGQERPPPTAWAGRSQDQLKHVLKATTKKRISHGLAMWTGWGSHHDNEAIEKEEEKVKKKQTVLMSITKVQPKDPNSRSRSQGGAAALTPLRTSPSAPPVSSLQTSAVKSVPAAQAQTGQSAEFPTASPISPRHEANITTAAPTLEPAISKPNRPSMGPGTTMPFKLASPTLNTNHNDAAASTLTLSNASGIIRDDASSIVTTNRTPTIAATPAFSNLPTSHQTSPESRAANNFDPTHHTVQPTTVSHAGGNLFPEDERPGSKPFTPSSAIDADAPSDVSDTHTPTHRPSPIVVTGEAVAVPLRTPEAAAREHARASSKVNGEGLIRGGDAVDKYPSGVTGVSSGPSNGALGGRFPSGVGDEGRPMEVVAAGGGGGGGGRAAKDDPGSWADGVLREMDRRSLEGLDDRGEPVVKQGRVMGSKERPEVTRFVTATD